MECELIKHNALQEHNLIWYHDKFKYQNVVPQNFRRMYGSTVLQLSYLHMQSLPSIYGNLCLQSVASKFHQISLQILRRQISQGDLDAKALSNQSTLAPWSLSSRKAKNSHAPSRSEKDSSSVTQPHLTQSPSLKSLYAPVTVAIMSSHYFGGEYAREVPECTLEGQPLKCTYVDTLDLANQTWADSATATWWHGAGLCHRQVIHHVVLLFLSFY